MPNLKELKETNRQLRLFNQALQKQFVYLKDRLKRQNLVVESLAQHLGFRAYWEDGEVFWQRVRIPIRIKSWSPRKRQSDAPPIRHRQGASRHLRGNRPTENRAVVRAPGVSRSRSVQRGERT